MPYLHLRFTLLLLFIGSSLLGQTDSVQVYIGQGIDLYDQGQYGKAINRYKKALQLDEHSSMAHYEIALTYLATKDYKLAEQHSAQALSYNDQNALPASIALGNALDLQGKSDKAIKVYEEGIDKYDHYLLHYNHAMTCLNSGYLDKAYDSAINAITSNPSHSSSHLILSKIMDAKNSRIKAILPLYYFLLLEPHTERAEIEYATLKGYLNQGVSKTAPTKINISIPVTDESEFSAAEMMISMLKATEGLEENKGKTDLERFAETNQNLFTILGELKKEQEGFWWNFYVPIYATFAEKEVVEPFSYYISISQGDEVLQWLENNDEQFQQLVKLLSGDNQTASSEQE